MFGIATIAVGEKSLLENKKCIQSVRSLLEIPTITLDKQIFCDTLVPSKYCQVPEYTDMQYSRLIKTNLINLIPKKWQYCIYLDSDTRVMNKDLLNIIEILKSGYDLVICPSDSQDFWHIGEPEKTDTFDLLGYRPLQLQAGVFGFSVNKRTEDFFLHWSNNYMVYSNQDQAALVRTLHEIPIKIWLTGYPFNNGSVIKHLFGVTR